MYNRYKNSMETGFNSRYEEDYVVNPFDKNIWGPKMWEVMHTFSFSYPIKPTNIDMQSAHNFYTSIGTLIPCKECSKHCLEYIRTNSPKVNSKDELIDWVFNFHNEVNIRLGKPYYDKSDLLDRYENVAFCNS